MEYFEQFGSSENSGKLNQGYRDRFEVKKIRRRMEINPNSGKRSKYADTGNRSKQSTLNEECKETQIPQNKIGSFESMKIPKS